MRIRVASSLYDRLGRMSTSLCYKLHDPSRTYFFNMETWNTKCTANRLGGSASSYGTSMTLLNTSNGPIYFGLSLPHLPNRSPPLVRKLSERCTPWRQSWHLHPDGLHLPFVCLELLTAYAISIQLSSRTPTTTWGLLSTAHCPVANMSVIYKVYYIRPWMVPVWY